MPGPRCLRSHCGQFTDIDSVPAMPGCSIEQIVSANSRYDPSPDEGWDDDHDFARRRQLVVPKRQSPEKRRRNCSPVTQVWFPPHAARQTRPYPPTMGPNVGWMLMRTSNRTLWIINEWLRAARGECKAEAQIHPRDQNVWNKCISHRLICAHEQKFVHPKLVGHDKSRIWPHQMFGSCWQGRRSQPAGTLSTSGKRGKCDMVDHGLTDFRRVYRKFQSPPLINLSDYRETEDGFLEVINTWDDEEDGM
eukprot:4038861-Prymnesium_polylepis.2